MDAQGETLWSQQHNGRLTYPESDVVVSADHFFGTVGDRSLCPAKVVKRGGEQVGKLAHHLCNLGADLVLEELDRVKLLGQIQVEIPAQSRGEGIHQITIGVIRKYNARCVLLLYVKDGDNSSPCII